MNWHKTSDVRPCKGDIVLIAYDYDQEELYTANYDGEQFWPVSGNDEGRGAYKDPLYWSIIDLPPKNKCPNCLYVFEMRDGQSIYQHATLEQVVMWLARELGLPDRYERA